MTDRRTLWHAAVSAAVEVLHAELPDVHVVDRQQIALTIARVMLEKLDEPMSVRANLDAFIAAFSALGVASARISELNMVDRVDHVVTIGVHSHAEVTALAAELDLPRPVHRLANGYRYVETSSHPERGTSIAIQGAVKSTRNTAA